MSAQLKTHLTVSGGSSRTMVEKMVDWETYVYETLFLGFKFALGFLRILKLLWGIIGPASVRAYKIGVVGNNWLVGNAIFSETTLRIFLIFCMKLGDYKARKVTESDI